jgi:hypothetical protein
VSKHRDLNSGDVFPASLLDALEEYVSTLAANIVLSQTSTTAVKVAGGTGNGQAALGISSSATAGVWRYITADATASHPGGAAGTYDVLAIASANDFAGAGDTDNTDYRFGLQIVAAGGSGSGTLFGKPVTAWRKIGIVEWSGTAITNVTQLVGPDKSAVITPTAPLASATPFIARGTTAQTAPLAKFQDVSQATLVQVAADGKVQFGSAADTNLYRSAAGVLKTDGALDAASYKVAGVVLASTHLSDSASLARLAGPTFTGTVTVPTLAVSGSGKTMVTLADTGAQLSGLTIGGDTNLYRSAADSLKTDDTFRSALDQVARDGAATQVTSGAVSGNAGFLLGSSGDTNLYRSAAGVLKTDGAFTSGPITSDTAATSSANTGVYLNPSGKFTGVRSAAGVPAFQAYVVGDTNTRVSIGSEGIVAWGPGNAVSDTNLYRSAVGKLATDGTFLAVGGLASGAATGNSDFANAGVWAAAAGQVSARRAANAAVWRSSVVGDTGDRFTFDTAGLMQWGPSPGTGVFDTNLYRSSADVLRTDDSLVVALDTYARGGVATQVATGDISILGVGGAARAGIVFGSAADTNLYRSAADTLKTDDSLVVAGTLSASDATYQTIETYSASMGAGVASGGGQIMLRDGTMGNQATRLSMFYFDPAHYAITGKTTKVRLSVACLPGATAPLSFVGAALTVELWQVTSISAGIGALGGAALASVPFVLPAANSINAGVSADVSGLTAGVYVLRVAVSGGSSTAAGSDTVFDVAVQVRRN